MPPGPKHLVPEIRILGAKRLRRRSGAFLGAVGVWYNSRRRAGTRSQEMGVMELARAVAESGTTRAVAS